MAKDELTGNMPTENLVYYFDEAGEDPGIDKSAFLRALGMVTEVFPSQ